MHGILVQLPMPAHINEQRVLDAISLEKDVDGFAPANLGALAMRGREPLYVSCTPQVGKIWGPLQLIATSVHTATMWSDSVVSFHRFCPIFFLTNKLVIIFSFIQEYNKCSVIKYVCTI